jgi:hypothetical protein
MRLIRQQTPLRHLPMKGAHGKKPRGLFFWQEIVVHSTCTKAYKADRPLPFGGPAPTETHQRANPGVAIVNLMPEYPCPQSSIHETTCSDLRLTRTLLLRRETGDEYATGERFIYRRNQINIHAHPRYVA